MTHELKIQLESFNTPDFNPPTLEVTVEAYGTEDGWMWQYGDKDISIYYNGDIEYKYSELSAEIQGELEQSLEDALFDICSHEDWHENLMCAS